MTYRIVDGFVEVLEKGLAKEGEDVPMLPTYVFGWPTGQEKGAYLAVDLGGTNLRVCHVELEGDGKFEVTQTKYRLCVPRSGFSCFSTAGRGLTVCIHSTGPRSRSTLMVPSLSTSAPSAWVASFRTTTPTTRATSFLTSLSRSDSPSVTLACE